MRKFLLLSTFSFFLFLSKTNAQSPVGLTLDSNGIVIIKGVHGSGPNLPEAGSGTKLIWYPKKAAFRAGFVNFDDWDNTNIGEYSTAIGYDVRASAPASTALGAFTIASNEYALATGNQTTASGFTS